MNASIQELASPGTRHVRAATEISTEVGKSENEMQESGDQG